MFEMRIYNNITALQINIIIFEMPRNYPLRQLYDNIIRFTMFELPRK
jgi:hypothetical protein